MAGVIGFIDWYDCQRCKHKPKNEGVCMQVDRSKLNIEFGSGEIYCGGFEAADGEEADHGA